MAWPWVRARQVREAEHQAFLAALAAVVQTVTALAEANRATADVLHTYLSMFSTPSAPLDRPGHDDLSEVIKEAQRAEAAGIPAHLTQAGQLQWVYDHATPSHEFLF